MFFARGAAFLAPAGGVVGLCITGIGGRGRRASEARAAGEAVGHLRPDGSQTDVAADTRLLLLLAVDDGARGGQRAVNRDGKIQRVAPANDERVDADDATILVEQGPAGVAGV